MTAPRLVWQMPDKQRMLDASGSLTRPQARRESIRTPSPPAGNPRRLIQPAVGPHPAIAREIVETTTDSTNAPKKQVVTALV